MTAMTEPSGPSRCPAGARLLVAARPDAARARPAASTRRSSTVELATQLRDGLVIAGGVDRADAARARPRGRSAVPSPSAGPASWSTARRSSRRCSPSASASNAELHRPREPGRPHRAGQPRPLRHRAGERRSPRTTSRPSRSSTSTTSRRSTTRSGTRLATCCWSTLAQRLAGDGRPERSGRAVRRRRVRRAGHRRRRAGGRATARHAAAAGHRCTAASFGCRSASGSRRADRELTSTSDMLRRADIAMYTAKRAGGGWARYQTGMSALLRARDGSARTPGRRPSRRRDRAVVPASRRPRHRRAPRLRGAGSLDAATARTPRRPATGCRWPRRPGWSSRWTARSAAPRSRSWPTWRRAVLDRRPPPRDQHVRPDAAAARDRRGTDRAARRARRAGRAGSWSR